ncbi:MAG: hypothetical protein CMJ85_09385 [Planctomycetes bacterium]|nr:hypothetical protein [Planctomycetota bacterium]MDP6423969.1 hypothetical protein [Planctomycetota bacterium]
MIETKAYPRVGLLGNPSDGYGGRVVSFTFRDFSAHVTSRPAPEPGARGRARELLDAAMTIWAKRGTLPNVSLSADSSIPRELGLSGSSAIVIAGLRALAAETGTPLEPIHLAYMALDAEVDVLGTPAGPQDRVVQAFEGLIDMSFPQVTNCSWTHLDVALLPPLLLAWNTTGAAPSSVVHGDLRARYEAGDAVVVGAMPRFAAIAAEGINCLERGDHARLAQLVDTNFDLRKAIMDVSESDQRLVALARAAGCSAKQCGSGGSIVIVAENEDHLAAAERSLTAAGATTLRPTL